MPKTPKTVERVAARKEPRVAEKVESYFKKSPSWRFSISDTDHDRWSVLDSCDDVVEDSSDPSGTVIVHRFSKSIDRVLLDSLKARESTTWGVLITQNGGRTNGTNSHFIPMGDLIKEARERATALKIVEDGLFSLRLDGTHRVFGVLEDGVLNIVWFDRTHEICPSTR